MKRPSLGVLGSFLYITTLRVPILISFPRVKCKANGDELETGKRGKHLGSQRLEAQTQA